MQKLLYIYAYIFKRLNRKSILVEKSRVKSYSINMLILYDFKTLKATVIKGVV